MDWTLALVGATFVAVLAVLRGLVEIRRSFEESVIELDARLAATIAKIIEEFGGGYEPPNPIQQAIGEMLKARVQAIPRDSSGQFTEIIDSESKT